MDTTRTDRISDLEAQAAAIFEEVERLESDMHRDVWTRADEAKVETLRAEGWKLSDEATILRAQAALLNPRVAARVASLESPPAGPTHPGDPMVWHEGREYFAEEVIALLPAQATAA